MAEEVSSGELTVSQAGHRGGRAVAEKYGPEFHRRIGKLGGDRTSQDRGPEFYAEIGRKGGAVTLAKHGPEHYGRIGRKGGLTARYGEYAAEHILRGDWEERT